MPRYMFSAATFINVLKLEARKRSFREHLIKLYYNWLIKLLSFKTTQLGCHIMISMTYY